MSLPVIACVAGFWRVRFTPGHPALFAIGCEITGVDLNVADDATGNLVLAGQSGKIQGRTENDEDKFADGRISGGLCPRSHKT